MKFYKTLLMVTCLISTSSALANIYRWVDEDGKVHYGNVQKGIHGKDTEEVVIKDKYKIPNVEENEPIPYKEKEFNRMISLSLLSLDLPKSESEDIRIGRVTCGRPVDLYWTKGAVDFGENDLAEAIVKTFSESNYNIESALSSVSSGGSLELKARLLNLKMNLCAKKNKRKVTRNSSYVKIEWELYDPVLKKELFKGITKGSHHAGDQEFVKDGTSLSVQAAITASANNLLADTAFVAHIKPEDISKLKEQFDEELAIPYSLGSGLSDFSAQANTAKNNTVIVKTDKGHGSGVLINDDGYILTNEHVIAGAEEELKVTIGKREFEAKLIRSERVRDVALIKIEGYSGIAQGAKVARKKPQIGSELYVIGAPLSVELQHTITKGIVSATRNIGGLPYFQTDASINPGNSGGGVFDENGELVALAVSGIFSRGGAGLSINYLIPINDALDTLRIGDNSSIADKVKDKTLVEAAEIIFQETKGWMDKPVIQLF